MADDVYPEISFDAQLVLRELAKDPEVEQQPNMLIVKLLPHGVMDLIGERLDAKYEELPKGLRDLLKHYVDDAQERTERALKELTRHGYVSKHSQVEDADS